MKLIKKIIFYVITVTVIIGCEKESTMQVEDLQESVTISKDELLKQIQNSNGLEENVTGVFNGNMEGERNRSVNSLVIASKETLNTVVFYEEQDEFDLENCVDLGFEDFEEASVPSGGINGFTGPLDENSNNNLFSPGDIAPGVTFSGDTENSQLNIRNFEFIEGESNRLSVNQADEDIKIAFSIDNVRSVRFLLYEANTFANIDVEVYGMKGFIAKKTYYAGNDHGTFVGIRTNEPIAYIIVKGPDMVNDVYVWERIDNFGFGACDSDNDGCLNDEDAYPISDLSETIVIDGCDTGVENGFVDCGTTMMDEINSLIAEISEKAQEPRSRYRRPYRAQSQFSMGMYYLLAGWQSRGYITRYDNSAIMKCVYNSNIDFENLYTPQWYYNCYPVYDYWGYYLYDDCYWEYY